MPNDLHRILSSPFKMGKTAYYLYHEDELIRRYGGLKNALPPCFDIYYSVKANPQQRLLELLRTQDRIGFDVSSIAEIRLARAAMCNPKKMLFVGPGKMAEEIAEAVGLGVQYFVLESAQEAQILQEIAYKRKCIVDILVRVNPAYPVKGVKMAMAGRETQFGIPQEELEGLLQEIQAMGSLRFRGIHAYVGTRILSAVDCFENVKNALLLGQELHQKGYSIAVVDVGGGIGIPYYSGEPGFDLEAFGLKLAGLLGELSSIYLAQLQCILETGRFLVGPIGEFVTQVVAVRLQDQAQVVYVNGSTNQFVLAHGGQLHSDRSLVVEFLSSQKDEGQCPTRIVGNLTMDSGTFVQEISAPHLQAGDLVIFKNAGAYGSAASPAMTNLLGFSPEYLFTPGEIQPLTVSVP